MTDTDARNRLLQLLCERGFRQGQFTLASGKQSRYYVDGKTLMLQQEGARLFGRWIVEQLLRVVPAPTAIGGLELGAVPIACAAMLASPQPLNSFIVRKTTKTHGRGLAIEGVLEAGDRVAVVDDVITTAGSTLKAIRAVENRGCEVVAVYCLVDRQEGHVPEFSDYRSRFVPAFTLQDLIAAPGT